MNRCDICLEETCKGAHNCHCDSCSHVSECYRFLHATIRITNRCTQECDHCCFRSSPKSNVMMTLNQAKKTSIFLMNNGIKSLNVMGGEFFCNKDWKSILYTFLCVSKHVRLVTNGDWYPIETIKRDLIELKNEFPTALHVSVSNDSWHTNKYVKDVEKFLMNNDFLFNIGTKENDNSDVIVPIGRSDGDCGFYGTFGCYRHKPEHMYSFMIDEVGKIYKCAFGVCDYAIVDDYINGGFRARFKEFNKKFYSIFIPSCASCIRAFMGGETHSIISHD